MVNYEWDVELVLIDGEEIIDHNYCSSFAEAKTVSERKPEDGHRHDIVLVRDDDKGREWAYLKDGKLPEYFSDAYGTEGSKVPKKFHTEVERAS